MTNWSLSAGFGGTLGGLSARTGGRSGGSSAMASPISPWARGPVLADTIRERQNPGLGGTAPPLDAQGQPLKKNAGPMIPRQTDDTGGWYEAGLRERLRDPTANTPTGSLSPKAMEIQSIAQTLATQYPELANNLTRAFNNNLSGEFQAQGRALQANELNQNYGFGMRELGIREGNIGIDRQGNALDLARVGIDRRENETERDYISRLRGLAEDAFTNRSTRISFEGQDKARDIKSAGVTGGSLFSAGQRYDQGTNYLRTLSDLEAERNAMDKERAGFDRREAGTRFEDERLGLTEQQVGLANQKLDLMAGQLGIDRDRLTAGLNNGLAQLGLQGQIDAQELLIRSLDISDANAGIYREIMNTAIAISQQPGDMMLGFNTNIPFFPNG